MNFPETDSIIPEYRDSVLKIIKSKYITSQFSILWKNKPVIYLDSNARTMEIDTLGIHAAIKREKNDPIPKNERPAPSFEILFLNLFITDSSAESHTFLKNSGIDAYYQLKKQNEEWIVTKCKWGWR